VNAMVVMGIVPSERHNLRCGGSRGSNGQHHHLSVPEGQLSGDVPAVSS